MISIGGVPCWRRCLDNPASRELCRPGIEQLLARAAGCRETDANRIALAVIANRLERNSQIRAAFRGCERVHFVDDDVLDAPPERPPAFLAQEQRQTLGRRDQDVGRMIAKPASLARRCVTGADAETNRAFVATELPADSIERPTQVALDVVIQAAKRRDIDAANACR